MSKYSPLTATRLREAMKNKNITAQELSERSGVGKSSISQYLNGKYTPKNVAAKKLATVLDVKPEWLMAIDYPEIDLKDFEPSDYPVNKDVISKLVYGADTDISIICEDTNIRPDRIIRFLKGGWAKKHEIISLSNYFSVPPAQLIDQNIERVDRDERDDEYLAILDALDGISQRLKDKDKDYDDEVINIIEAYRSADELTQAMVRRTLGID